MTNEPCSFLEEIETAEKEAGLFCGLVTSRREAAYEATTALTKAWVRVRRDDSDWKRILNKIYTHYVLPEMEKLGEKEISNEEMRLLVRTGIDAAANANDVTKLTIEGNYTGIICGGGGVGKTYQLERYIASMGGLFDTQRYSPDNPKIKLDDDMSCWSTDGLVKITHDIERARAICDRWFYPERAYQVKTNQCPSLLVELAYLPDYRENGVLPNGLIQTLRHNGRGDFRDGCIKIILITAPLINALKRVNKRNNTPINEGRDADRKDLFPREVIARHQQIAREFAGFVIENAEKRRRIDLGILDNSVEGRGSEMIGLVECRKNAIHIFNVEAIINMLAVGRTREDAIQDLVKISRKNSCYIYRPERRPTKSGELMRDRGEMIFFAFPDGQVCEEFLKVEGDNPVLYEVINQIKAASSRERQFIGQIQTAIASQVIGTQTSLESKPSKSVRFSGSQLLKKLRGPSDGPQR